MPPSSDELFPAREPDERASAETATRVHTVRELTRRIEKALGVLGRVSVEGEISRVMRASSGHVYFDLKDIDAKLACTIWKSQLAQAARFELKEGMQVVAHGKLDVYAPRGTYSLNVQRLEPAGIGALLAELERRKSELMGRGWFDRKRALPTLPRRIGVATSRDGAAFQDFLRTRSLRWPGYPILLAHTPVQGAGAAVEIARAILRLDQAGVDVIVICRGGGSLEDLWAFNELALAEAIWASRTPVVSGVGHEVDVTLADLIADWRAHTPTDAAQVVIPDRAARLGDLELAAAHLARAMDQSLGMRAERLERAAKARVLRDPRAIVAVRRERLLRLAGKLGASIDRRASSARAQVAELERTLQKHQPGKRLAERLRSLDAAGTRLHTRMASSLERRRSRLALAGAQLEALSPTAILGRGYSITTRSDGRLVRSTSDATEGETLRTRVSDGQIRSRVLGEAADAAGQDR